MYKKFIDKGNINNVFNQHHIWSLSIEFSEYLYYLIDNSFILKR